MTTTLDPGSEETSPCCLVELENLGTTSVLVVRGALRHNSIAALEAQVDQLGCLPCERVILDLRELTEMDAVGANVVLGLYHYVVGRGGAFSVQSNGQTAATLRSVSGSLIPLVIFPTKALRDPD